MTPINWILVPIDYSNDSKLALIEADSQAAENGCGLVLLHVQRPADRVQTHFADGGNALVKWSRILRNTPAPQVAYVMCPGDPVQEILRIARQYDVAKIIMGRGGDPLQAGHVAQAVGQGFPGIVQMLSETHSDVSLHALVKPKS